MNLKVKPDKLICLLNEIGIIIHSDIEIEKITIENQFLKPKIFNSHIFSDYRVNYFRYRITIKGIAGEIILDEFNGRLELIKNNLTDEK